MAWLATVVLPIVSLAAVSGWIQRPSALKTAPTGRTEVSARRIVSLGGIDRGFCAVMACEELSLPLSLARTTQMILHVQSTNAALIDRLRSRLIAEGLYGKRVIAEVGAAQSLPYADSMVDLLVCTSLNTETLGQVSVREITRVLRPGGAAILGGREGLTATAFRTWVKSNEATVEFREEGNYVWARLIKKPSPLTDEWTHWQHGPDNNPVSSDSTIRAPYMTQFLSLPYYSPMPSISVICNGVQFRAAGHMAIHEREEPFINTLFASNAHNGILLWTRPLPEGYLVHRSLFVAQPDELYLLEPQRCLVLDPMTGEEKDEIGLPAGTEPGAQWQWIALEDGLLYGLIGKEALPAEVVKRKRAVGAWGWDELSQGYYTSEYPWGYGRLLVAIDPKTKQEVWRHKEMVPIDSRALCLKAGRVFIHGESSYVAALDSKTGAQLWRNEEPKLLTAIAEENDQGLGFKTTPYALCTDEVLFFAGRGRRNVVGVRAKDGAHLWTISGAYNATNLLFTGGYLYAHIPSATKIDPLSGAILADLGISKRSCARFTGCPEALFHRGSIQVGEGTTRYELSTGRAGVIHAFRPPCNDGIIPAEGLLHITQWDCDCNLQLMGGIGLTSAGDFQFGREATDAECLTTYPALRAAIPAFAMSDADWPTYRADNSRSCCTSAVIPNAATVRWRYGPVSEGRPSAPTAAGGLVFVAGEDCRVKALDVATGVERWNFVAGGAIRLPPTLWGGRAYVASADGHVYCLQAATGRPIWRFRVAPIERRIMAYGALSSTWPVNSGVLVDNGIAYAAAGIINYDGTHVVALDAATGRLRWQNNSSGHLNPELRAGVSVQGDLALAPGRLLMAGGNVACPAIYDLSDGSCRNTPPGPHPPGAHRGSEVCSFLGRYIMIGGQRLFTDPTDPISTNLGVVFQGEGIAPDKGLPGRVPPVFGNGVVAMAARGPLVCVDTTEMERWLKLDDRQARFTPRWVAESLQGAVGMAVAANGVVATGREQVEEGQTGGWVAAAFDLSSGEELWRVSLPDAPLPGGLCVDGQGRTIVVLEKGGVVSIA